MYICLLSHLSNLERVMWDWSCKGTRVKFTLRFTLIKIKVLKPLMDQGHDWKRQSYIFVQLWSFAVFWSWVNMVLRNFGGALSNFFNRNKKKLNWTLQACWMQSLSTWMELKKSAITRLTNTVPDLNRRCFKRTGSVMKPAAPLFRKKTDFLKALFNKYIMYDIIHKQLASYIEILFCSVQKNLHRSENITPSLT